MEDGACRFAGLMSFAVTRDAARESESWAEQ
jgi:hypothetical protein